MDEVNLSEAVDYLLHIAKQRGKISKKTFEDTCEGYFISGTVLANRFRATTGTPWQEYRIKLVKNQNENINIAIHIARQRALQPGPWWPLYEKHTGTVLVSGRKKIVFVGSRYDEAGVYHDIVDVATLRVLTLSWMEVHQRFPALARLLGEN